MIYLSVVVVWCDLNMFFHWKLWLTRLLAEGIFLLWSSAVSSYGDPLVTRLVLVLKKGCTILETLPCLYIGLGSVRVLQLGEMEVSDWSSLGHVGGKSPLPCWSDQHQTWSVEAVKAAQAHVLLGNVQPLYENNVSSVKWDQNCTRIKWVKVFSRNQNAILLNCIISTSAHLL